MKFRSERKQVQGADRTDLHALELDRTAFAPGSSPSPASNSAILRPARACSATLPCMAGRKLRWDAKKEDFIGDAEASRLLTRQQRAPWNLIKV